MTTTWRPSTRASPRTAGTGSTTTATARWTPRTPTATASSSPPAAARTAAEVCDELDHDCDGETNDYDFDGDGYAGESCGDDCDDEDPLINPGAVDDCTDGVDNNCDGTYDFQDADGDGQLAEECGGKDCDDEAATTYTGADELCGDGVDNNCDGNIDDADLDRDDDLDVGCGGTDCDDTDGQVHPGLPEFCDGVDRNCDGSDAGDRDGDGEDCDAAEDAGDCNDGLPSVSTATAEICDGLDNDCNGVIDDGEVEPCVQALPGGMDFALSAGDWEPDGVLWRWEEESVRFSGSGFDGWRALIYEPAFIEAPWTFEVDVARVSGEGEAPIGIYISRDTGGNQDGYYLVLYETGHVWYEIGRLMSGVAVPEFTDGFRTSTVPGEGLPNRLRAVHDGVTLSFYINDQKANSITTGSDLAKGYPALLVFDEAKGTVEARFDNAWLED